MSKHTPTPWMARPGTTTGAEVVAKKPRGGDYVVARCGGKDREANAAFIVCAVNAHEALVDALRLMMTGSEHKTMTVGGITITGWSTIRMPDEAALDAARAALALVEPKP